MIKKLKDLDKEEKILLIQVLAAGQVDKNCLNDYTLVCTEYKDYFLGLIKSATAGVTLICLGEAEKAKKVLFQDTLLNTRFSHEPQTKANEAEGTEENPESCNNKSGLLKENC